MGDTTLRSALSDRGVEAVLAKLAELATFSDSTFVFDVDLFIDGRERLAAAVFGTVGAREFDLDGKLSVEFSGERDTRPAIGGTYFSFNTLLLADDELIWLGKDP